MSFTEKDLRELGFRECEDGKWRKGEASVQRNDSGQVPQLESDTRNGSKGKNAVQVVDEGSSGRRYKIVVRAHYRRYVDHGNVCAKWFIDELVRAGIIPSDSNKDISDEDTRAVKVEAWEPETTTIKVYEI